MIIFCYAIESFNTYFVHSQGETKIEIVSGEASSIYSGTVANSFDGDLSSRYHSVCAKNTDIWLRLHFSSIRCVKKVLIFQTHLSSAGKYRMDGTKVILSDTNTETDTLCGTLKISQTLNATDQLHYTDCENSCGDTILLAVNHPNTQHYEGCMHVYEVMAYTDCPAGHYRSSEEECVLCPLGQYGGGSSCSWCQEGYESNPLRTNCGM